jgi:ligand-binding sensor domain-containing protein
MRFFIWIGFILLTRIISAQNFHHITVEMGLSNSTTFSIVKDGKGLMWFSTKEGIDRYDGAHFKNYILYPPAEITKYGLRRNKF